MKFKLDENFGTRIQWIFRFLKGIYPQELWDWLWNGPHFIKMNFYRNGTWQKRKNHYSEYNHLAKEQNYGVGYYRLRIH